jgi:hypothetical protein
MSEMPYFSPISQRFQASRRNGQPTRRTWDLRDPPGPPSEIGVNQRLPQFVEITRGYLASLLRGLGQTLSPVETEVRRKVRAALVTRPLPGQGEKPFPGAISPSLKTPGFQKGATDFRDHAA